MTSKAFTHPQDIYRGTDFWMLNGALNDEDIVYQLTEMKEKGVYSFIARTYLGLKSDYPGPSFKEKTRLIIKTSKELGLKVFLQAGYMPEAVLGLPESSALRYIYPVKKGEENGRPLLCEYNGISFVEHNSVTYLDMFDPEAMDYYVKTSYEDMWREFEDEYGKTVLSIWVDEPSYNGSYLPWTPKLEGIFAEKWGYSLSQNVWKLFYDSEDSGKVRYHYRVIMRDLLEENYFKKIEKWCHSKNLLFSGHLMMEDTLRTQIMRAQACMPYYKYFDIPGMDVLRAEMDWIDDPIHSTDMPNRRKFVQYITVTQCVSAAKQAGKEHILAEMYGVGGENFTFRNMVHWFDLFAASGINHRSVHGIFYSLHGRGKRAYPPHISYYQPFWPKYKNVSDYCARVSSFISDGRSSSRIAVIHPLETAYMLYRGAVEKSPEGSEELSSLDYELYDIIASIRSKADQVDFADLASIRDMGKVENGKFCVGLMSYDTVILPRLAVITPKLLELLKDFAAQGGKIITYGSAPTLIDGEFDEALAKQIEEISKKAKTVSDVLDLITPPTYSISGIGAANILVNHRICENGEKFFIFNKDCAHKAMLKLSTECKGALYVYDAFSGEATAYPYTAENGRLCTELEIEAGASILLSVEPESASITLNKATNRLKTSLLISGEWSVNTLSQNTLLLENCKFKKGDGEFSNELPISAVQYLLSREEYRGEITLKYEFDTSSDFNGLSLALEDPTEQQIMLDGNNICNKPDGYFCDKSFETVSLGKVEKGHHELLIVREFFPLSKVTNALTQLFETRYGIELEPMYLLGDFKVNGHVHTSANGTTSFEPQFVLSKSDITPSTYGELTTDGFPFYVGEVILSKVIDLPQDVDLSSATLNIGVMNAGCGEAFVNGISVGDINRAPSSLAIDAALKYGKNTIEIKLYTTLYNIIGPFHRPLGNVGDTFGGGYQNPDAAWMSINTASKDWHLKMNSFAQTWTNRYNVVPLGIKDVNITF